MRPRKLSDIDDLHTGADAMQQLVPDKAIVNDDIRPAEQRPTAHRDQLGVTRTGADQIDSTLLSDHTATSNSAWTLANCAMARSASREGS